MSEGLTISQLAEKNAVLVTDIALLQKKLDAVTAEASYLLGEIKQHSQSTHFCEVCGKDDPCENDDVCWSLKHATPATDLILNVLRADAISNALDSCSACCDTDCVMDTHDISYEDAGLRTSGAIELRDGLVAIAAQLRKGEHAAKDGE